MLACCCGCGCGCGCGCMYVLYGTHWCFTCLCLCVQLAEAARWDDKVRQATVQHGVSLAATGQDDTPTQQETFVTWFVSPAATAIRMDYIARMMLADAVAEQAARRAAFSPIGSDHASAASTPRPLSPRSQSRSRLSHQGSHRSRLGGTPPVRCGSAWSAPEHVLTSLVCVCAW